MTSNNGMSIVKTPVRLSFFGGGTDVPDYFNCNKGAVLGTTLNKYTFVTLNSLERLFGDQFRVSYSKLESVNDIEDIKHDIVRAVLRRHRDSVETNFLDIHSFADLPSGTGIGSSSSFTVGLLNALSSLQGIYKSPKELAEEAIQIERRDLGESGGWQDQLFAAYGGFNTIRFSRQGYSVEPLVISPSRLSALESSCLFVFTRTQRSSAEIQNSVMTEENIKLKTQNLRTLYDSVFSAEDILHNASSDLEAVTEFGYLLAQAWEQKKSLSPEVSNTQIDNIYECAIESGAYGGKICGAGGGGFLVLIAPPEKHAAIRRACNSSLFVDISFDTLSGSQVIFLRR